MNEPYEGGCLCGAVRYRMSGPVTNRCVCHCRSCRGASGAPFVAWGTVARDAFSVTRGSLAIHRSSPQVERGFCGACGTALSYARSGDGARPNEIDVSLTTLDDPAAIRPEYHIWVSEKVPWLALGDGLPQHAEWKTGEA